MLLLTLQSRRVRVSIRYGVALQELPQRWSLQLHTSWRVCSDATTKNIPRQLRELCSGVGFRVEGLLDDKYPAY